MISRWILGFLQIHPKYEFQENREYHIRKIWEFTPVIIFVISPQKWQFGLENESFEISPNSARS